MKRRVFSKTTPFHTFKKKKKKKEKEQNGVVLNDTVPLSSSPPNIAAGKKGKRGFCLNFFRSLSRLEPTDRTHWPTTHLPENRVEPNLGSRDQWPTSQLLPMRKSHALGSINRTQER